LARHLWPKLKCHKLPELAKKFKIVYNAHHALDDAQTCGTLVQMASEEFEPGKSIEGLLEDLGVEVKDL
jgi:DNA polymerase III alpha subunit (gram-positive type)